MRLRNAIGCEQRLIPDNYELGTLSLEAHERELVVIDDEIEALMRTIRLLKFRRQQHQNQIKRCKGLTTLARKLPPELLAHIFEECVRDGWTRIPLTASHVCSEWRKATSISTVWSHVYVNCNAKDPCGRTLFWLEKAQMSPLHITVEATNDGSRIPSILEVLLRRAAQWRTLTIKTTYLRHAKDILEPLRNLSSQELDTINVFLSEEFEENDDLAADLDLNVTDLAPLPHLRKICINRNIIPSPQTIPPHITDLSITLSNFYTQTKSSIGRALRLLQGLPVLQALSISLPYGKSREFEQIMDEDNGAGLLNLQSLELTGSREMFRILPHLLTPSLTRLCLRASLDPIGYPDEEIGLNVRNFIERAAPPLRMVELHDIDLSPLNFSLCLARLTRLKELRLHESDISDSVISHFTTSRGFCPLLERLDLRWCGQVSGQALVKLVQDRRANSLQVTGNPEGDPKATCIDMVTVINCSFVKEQDILDLSRSTVCRIVIPLDDYCRPFGCCQNERYRKRLQQHGVLRQKGQHMLDKTTLVI